MNTNPNSSEDQIRHHVYDDDIQEYDNRLPNWWLFTLYGAIAFSLVYWYAYHWRPVLADHIPAVEAELAVLRTSAEKSALVNLSDDRLWTLSQDAAIIAEGRQLYTVTCAACHGPELKGMPGSPCPNLTDNNWVYGGHPTNIYMTIANGVPAKGMPTWGPILGGDKMSKIAAFVMSHHKQGDPINIVPSAPLPGAVPAAAPAAAPATP